MLYVQTMNDSGPNPILNLHRSCQRGKKRRRRRNGGSFYLMQFLANLYWVSLYSRFSAESILWFQKRDISQVSSSWIKEKRFSCFICKPPDSSSPPSPIQETLRGRQCFHERTPWREREIRLDLGEREGISFSPQSHGIKSNQTLRRKAFLTAAAMTELTFTVEMLRLIGWFLWQRENGAVRSSPLLPLSLCSVFRLVMLGTGGPDLSRCKVNSFVLDLRLNRLKKTNCAVYTYRTLVNWTIHHRARRGCNGTDTNRKMWSL